MGVLPEGRLGLQEIAKRLTVGLRGVLPIGANRIPALAQALLIGIAILRDDRRDPLRMLHRQAESRGRAVVEDIDREALKPITSVKRSITSARVIEGVVELRAAGMSDWPKPGRSGATSVKSVRQQRNQIAKHMAGAREAMKQQELRRVLRPASR